MALFWLLCFELCLAPCRCFPEPITAIIGDYGPYLCIGQHGFRASWCLYRCSRATVLIVVARFIILSISDFIGQCNYKLFSLSWQNRICTISNPTPEWTALVRARIPHRAQPPQLWHGMSNHKDAAHSTAEMQWSISHLQVAASTKSFFNTLMMYIMNTIIRGYHMHILNKVEKMSITANDWWQW